MTKSISSEMSKQLRIADRITVQDIVLATSQARKRILEIGARFGWSEQELIASGLVDAASESQIVRGL